MFELAAHATGYLPTDSVGTVAIGPRCIQDQRAQYLAQIHQVFAVHVVPCVGKLSRFSVGLRQRSCSCTWGRVEEQLSSSIRILIVDDYTEWRRQVRLLLQARPEWQVIAEASDGSEAVQKVEELKPDLILLDIGLPKLTGIEAARRIRQLSPSSKIVFLSQNNDRDLVRAALSTGALGYVHKIDAAGELLPAIDAVLRGQQFVSSILHLSRLEESIPG